MKSTQVSIASSEILNHKKSIGMRLKREFQRIGIFLLKRNTHIELISAFLIILFIYTGINKLMDFEKFKFEMGRSPFIQNFSSFIATTLPPGEILLAILLIFKRTRLLGLYLSFFLMALFTGYIWLMLTYAYDLPCSCGGILSKMSWKDHFYFNLATTVLTALAVIFQGTMNYQRKTLERK